MANEAPTTYFTKFPNFTTNPRAPILKEFARFAKTQGWNPNTKTYKKEKSKCLCNEYDIHIGTIAHGTGGEKLQKLQALCRELSVEPVPMSMRACKKALGKVHVNIIDLLDACRRRLPAGANDLNAALQNLNLGDGNDGPIRVRIFKNIGHLRDYTVQTGRFFPKEKAKKEGLLRDFN